MKHAGATGGVEAMSNSLFKSDVATWGAKGRSITFAAARFHPYISNTNICIHVFLKLESLGLSSPNCAQLSILHSESAHLARI